MEHEDKTRDRLLSRTSEPCPVRVKPYIVALGIIWTFVLSASLAWNVYQIKHEMLEVARHEARVAHEKDVIYRRWNSMQGGVYVPVTEKTPPNGYLAVQDREVATPSGVVLTKVNPSYMTRMVHEIAARTYGVQGHITSLDPIRHENAPDAWETEALVAFQGGAMEISSVVDMGGQPHLRLMRPLFTENDCLRCHAIQGCRLGDIRGGISVSLPMKPFLAMERSRTVTVLLGHVLPWLLGLTMLGLGARRLTEQITRRWQAEKSLKQNRDRLEQINECLLGLGPDHDANIDRLTSLCGEMLGGASALYNRLQGERLCPVGQWRVPPGFEAGEDARGHICTELIRSDKEDVMLITDLPRTSYRESDPNVRACGLQTYFGQVVKCDGKRVGALCVLYQEDYQPDEDDRGILGIIASAIGNEDRRRQAEDALLESEENFRRLLTLAPIPLVAVNNKGRVTYFNDRFIQAFGYTHDEIPTLKEWWPRVFPDESYRRAAVDCWEASVREAAEENKDIEPTEYRVTCRNGSVRTMEASGIIMGDELLATFIDLTERKRTEEERRKLEERLQRSEKMEALGTLAGGVAHDLNNVLGVVVGYSEMLLLDLEKSSRERAQAREILKGGQRAAAIIQDLLTLARRGVPSRSILNPNKVLMDCQNLPELERLRAFHPNTRIETDLEPDLLNIAGSAVHLEKSFMNLVSNAAEAMPDGGAITIRTRNRYLDKPILGYDEVREGDYVVISFSDEGEGISPADLKHIFEPFYTKKVMGRSGTGLGLAVVWGTVKDHRGYVNVESEESKGTTFTLYFPVTREEITPDQLPVSVAEYIGKGESILVVDDVREQRELAAVMLEKMNYRVTAVPSGEEAVEYLKQHEADLLVLDMIMDPGMDGLDTYAGISKIHPGQKAIIVSGFAETDRVSRALDLGVGGYVKKPYVMEKLAVAVRRELDRPRA